MTCAQYAPLFVTLRQVAEEKLILALDEHTGWWSSLKLSQHTKLSRHRVSLALQRLKRRGVVECEAQLWRKRR